MDTPQTQTSRQKPRITLVTGANRGIGFNLCRLLAKENFSGIIYLTARTLTKAKSAVDTINKEFPDTQSKFIPFQLEMTSQEDRLNIANTVKTHGYLDFLVQNAGVFPKEFNQKWASDAIQVNCFSVMELNKLLIPYLHAQGSTPTAKITHVSSGAGHFYNCSEERQQWLHDLKYTYKDYTDEYDKYVKAIAKGDQSHYKKLGWASGEDKYTIYRASKEFLNGAVIHFSANHSWIDPLYKPPKQAREVKMVALCPNWVASDMGGENADHPVEYGAQCVRDAMDSNLNGVFLKDGRKQVPF